MNSIIFLQFLIWLILTQYKILEQITLHSITHQEFSIQLIQYTLDLELDLSIDYNCNQLLNIVIFFDEYELMTIESKQKLLFQITQQSGSITIPRSEIGMNVYCKLQVNSENPAVLQLKSYYSSSKDRILSNYREEHGILRNNSIITYNFDMKNIKSGYVQVTLTNSQGISMIKQPENNSIGNNNIEFQYQQSLCIFYEKNCTKFIQILCISEFCQYQFIITHTRFNNSMTISYEEIIDFELEFEELYLLIEQNQMNYILVSCNEQLQYYYQKDGVDYIYKRNAIEIQNPNGNFEVLLSSNKYRVNLKYSNNQQYRCKYDINSLSLSLNNSIYVEQEEMTYKFFNFNSQLNTIKLEIYWEEMLDSEQQHSFYISTSKEIQKPYSGISSLMYPLQNEIILRTNTTYLYFSMFVTHQFNYYLRLYDPVEDIIQIDDFKIKPLCPQCMISYQYHSKGNHSIYININSTQNILYTILIENKKEIKLNNLVFDRQVYFINAISNVNYTIFLVSLSSEIQYPKITIQSIFSADVVMIFSGEKYKLSTNKSLTYILDLQIGQIQYFIFYKSINLEDIILKPIRNNQYIKLNQIKPNILKIELENEQQNYYKTLSFNLYATDNTLTIFKYYQFTELSIENQIITQSFIYEPKFIRQLNDLIFKIQPFPKIFINNLENITYHLTIKSQQYTQIQIFNDMQSNLFCLIQKISYQLMNYNLTYEIDRQKYQCSKMECLIIQLQLKQTCSNLEISIQFNININNSSFQIKSRIYKLTNDRNFSSIQYLSLILIFIMINFSISIMIKRKFIKKKRIQSIS